MYLGPMVFPTHLMAYMNILKVSHKWGGCKCNERCCFCGGLL